ncbi:MAG: hypothetical protein U5K69_11870 [Balneolaceae bacterium]|nr:hypothetical protein [Balneolaceae bacterium]
MLLLHHLLIKFLANQDETGRSIFGLSESMAAILIPAVITLIVFVLGIIIRWVVRKREKRQELRAYKNIILNWIEQIKKVVNRQVESCSNFSTQLSEAENIQAERLSYNKLLVDKIEQISIDKYVNTFVINSTGEPEKNYEMTFKIIGQLKFLQDIEEHIPSIYEAYQKQTEEIMKEWNSNFAHFDSLVSNQTKALASNNQNDSFHSDVLKIANNWRAQAPNGRSSVTFTFSNLIMPLSSLINQELKQNSDNVYAFDLSACLQELRISYMKWEKLNQDFSASFSQIAENIEKSYDDLQSAKSYFQSISLKYFFKIT